MSRLRAAPALVLRLLAGLLAWSAAVPGWTLPPEHGAARAHRNVIIFVADGLKHDSVNAVDAPTLFRLRRQGVDFANSHAMFPTLTTPNAASIATGHAPGDTGDFGNSVYTGAPVFSSRATPGTTAGTPTPFLENDRILADVDEQYGNGNFLNEVSLLALARQQGFSTAAIGKLGPIGIQDVSQLKLADGRLLPSTTVFFDDETGAAGGLPLSAEIMGALKAEGLAVRPPARSQPPGTVRTRGTLSANVEQQRYFADVTTKVVLPMFKARGKPFVLVYWSRDPDASQHNEGDSLNKLVPGINGPTSRAGIANADANLGQILDYLDGEPELRDTTDVFVTSDHGFATISKHEIDARGHGTTSYASRFAYLDASGQPEVVPGWLPSGFLAIDLAHLLDLPLFDPDVVITIDGRNQYKPVAPALPATATRAQHTLTGNGLIGGSGAVRRSTDAKVVVAANGGSDLIYIPDQDRDCARRIVAFLSRQDYVGGVFVDRRLGPIPGALPLSAIGLEGGAQLPRPGIVVTFRTFAMDPGEPSLSAVLVSDTLLQEGQGMHGGFDRVNTFNNMIAIGPDFKRGYIDRAPAGNADVAQTLAQVLHLRLPAVGRLRGRVLREALQGGPRRVATRSGRAISEPDPSSTRATVLEFQLVGAHRYFDDACMIDMQRRRAGPGAGGYCR